MSISKTNVDGKAVEWTKLVEEYLRDKSLTGEKFSIDQMHADLRVPEVDRKYVRTLAREVYRSNSDYAKRVGVRLVRRADRVGLNFNRSELMAAVPVRRAVAAKFSGDITSFPTSVIVAELNRRLG